MGRKGRWFSSVKKALSPEPKEPKDLKLSKSKKKWFGKQKHVASDSDPAETTPELTVPPIPPPPQAVEEVKLTDEQNEETEDVTVVVNVAAESVAQAAPEVIMIGTISRFAGKSKEEIAAVRIQTTFRGYQARKALRAMRGLVRLKSLIEGPAVKRQVNNTMRCMQTLTHLQSQIHSRRQRMSEENQALQRQLLQKRAKELKNLKIGEEWDDSLQSKQQIEVNLLKKFEAAMRREKALAYAFTHQQTWKNQSKSTNLMFLDPNNPGWGWSWLERWMAARPWEKDTVNMVNDISSTKSTGLNIAGEISKSYARYQLNSDKNNSPTASQKSMPFNSLTTPSTPSKPTPPSGPRNKIEPSSSPRASTGGPDDDSKSMISIQSEHTRRHSIGVASSVRDDESLASSPSVPSYMVATQSARAKSRLQSPLGLESNGKPKKVSPVFAKKRLSFPPSPNKPRRHSGPPKVNTSFISEISMTVEPSLKPAHA